MLALGLGASVLIDASMIRLLIVPSLMFVFDKANWWAPRWLESGLGPPRASAQPTTVTRVDPVSPVVSVPPVVSERAA
jgi:RND superfamily putative drug exporter